MVLNCGSRGLEREARLAHAARAGQRHQPMLREPIADDAAILVTPDEAREPGADVGPGRLRQRELGRTLEDLTLEPARLVLRIETQRPQPFGQLPVDGKCIGVAARAVQAEDQQPRERLPQWVLPHESLQIGNGLTMASELKKRRHPQLACLQLELREAPDLRLRKVEIDELAVRFPSPQRESLVCPRQRLGRLEAAGLDDEPRESLRVDVVLRDREAVADTVSFDHG